MTIQESVDILSSFINWDSVPTAKAAWQTVKAHCTQPTDAQQLKPKMPDYLECKAGIERNIPVNVDISKDFYSGMHEMYVYIVRHFGH